MGAGLTTSHHGDTMPAPPATSAVAPLSSEENVPSRSTTAAAATTPLPPTSVSTANPRQHLREAHAAAATPHNAVTPPEQRLQPPEDRHAHPDAAGQRGHNPLRVAPTAAATPAEESRPPPSVMDTAVKRQPASIDGDAGAATPGALVADVEGGVRRMSDGDSFIADPAEEEGDHAETSPSPEVPEHAEESDVPPAPQPALAGPGTAAATAAAAGVAPAAPFTHVGDALAYRPVTRSASPGQALGQYDGLPLASVQQALGAKHKVFRICLTGGPCAGKSTMLSAIQAKIPQRMGFRVMCVPEAATLLVTGGMQWDGDLTVPQQSALLRTQLALEDQFYALAVATGAPTIIVSDRGTMDGRAFCSDAQFQEILRNVGSSIDVLRDRYDAVLHMVTSANGAEEFYNLDNPARYEDLDGARASDLRLQEMYVGHHMFRLLDNSTTFEEKIERGLQIVGQVVHKEQCAPATPSYYLVRRCPQELPVASASYTTYTTVLNNSQMTDIRLLVKREMADGSSMHFFKSIKDVTSVRPSSSAHSTPRAMSRASGGASFRSSYAGGARFPSPSSQQQQQQQRIESAQRISSREYNSLRQHRDRARAEVVMQATHFIYDGANYELTTLLAPSWAAGRQTLTVESCSALSTTQRGAAAALRLPPFLEVDREVPVESLTTAFLISHRETGALYTSLAFAPVFSRAIVTALGAHADTENILNSTLSTPRGHSALRAETSALLATPVAAEKPQRVKEAPPQNAEPAAPVRRGLGSLNVNTAPHGASTMSKSTPKKTVEARPQQEVPPLFLGGSVSVQQPRNVVTPSRFSLSGADDAGAEPPAVAPTGEHAQQERRVFARDPESILPPIELNRCAAH